jgi:hypothetical protein
MSRGDRPLVSRTKFVQIISGKVNATLGADGNAAAWMGKVGAGLTDGALSKRGGSFCAVIGGPATAAFWGAQEEVAAASNPAKRPIK